jgi:L-lactate dehydrogenase complex protein LldG
MVEGAWGVTEARAEILRRIDEALRDRPAPPDAPRAYRTTAPAGTDVLALFAERVSDYRADVRRLRQPDLAAVVGDVLAAMGARSVVVPSGIPDDEWLSNADVEVRHDDPPLSHADLDGADAVITGCAVAIAETGTIVLDAGPAQGRRALSLLPDHHLCVVRADQVVGSVPEALPRLDPRRPLTWISGPSATSDIELSRVEGVHGPRHLHVLLVDP